MNKPYNKLFKSDSQRVAFLLCVAFLCLRQYVVASVLRCSHLNRALVVAGNLELMYKAIPITIGVKLHEFSCTSGDSR
ncbi:hypothetical protein IFVP177_C1230001 [Vibrio parahaemolyticus]